MLRTGRVPEHFSDADRAVIACTDAITRDIRVSDEVFEVVRTHLSERHIVELTATVGAYNCVSRILEAARIDKE